jgi:alpha-tubulin suppressor-like RCC1 family protein
VGFLTEKIVDPMFIKDLSYKGIVQISCADNYSAALAVYGEIYVSGSLEGGKLGLGKGQKRGFQLNFRTIPDLPEIAYISTGVYHMLAIARNTNDTSDPKKRNQDGKTYSWGKN